MNSSSLVVRIASDLNDFEEGHEFKAWTEEQIGAWIVEGLGLVYDNRPDLFIENKVIKVTPCSILQDTCDCGVIRRVLGQSTKEGRLLRTISERGLEISFQWRGKPCTKLSGSNGARLESYAIDTVAEQLYVWPELPTGTEAYILVQCSVRPDSYTGGTLDASTEAAVIQWVLWRAKSMDMEISSSAMSAAKTHYSAFFDILGLSKETQTVIHKKDKT